MKLGTQDIDNFMLGTSQVDKMYQGTEHLWTREPQEIIHDLTTGILPTNWEVQDDIIIQDTHGITSEDYPNNYSNNCLGTCTMIAQTGFILEFSFTDFELEDSDDCQYDKINIYDGTDDTASLIGTFCDWNPPGVITSTGNALHLVFESDSSDRFKGFSITTVTEKEIFNKKISKK